MPFGGLLTTSLIGAGSSIFGALTGSSAAKKAAQQQKEMAIKAQTVADQNKQYGLDKTNENTGKANTALDPYSSAGATAEGQLGTALANPFTFNMQDDPGYAFRLAQGQKAVEGSAAARGGATGGGALKALTQYGQGFASNEYQNAFNRHQQQLQNLFQQAGIGLNAATTQSGNFNTNSSLSDQLLQQDSALASQNYTGAGNAAAAGTVGSANALIGGANGLANNAQQAFLYSLLKPSATPGYSPTLMQSPSQITSPYDYGIDSGMSG